MAKVDGFFDKKVAHWRDPIRRTPDQEFERLILGIATNLNGREFAREKVQPVTVAAGFLDRSERGALADPFETVGTHANASATGAIVEHDRHPQAWSIIRQWAASSRSVGNELGAAATRIPSAPASYATVGFSFPFGYLKGVAEHLTGEASALALWDWLAERIKDEPDNTNNRFEVATKVNEAYDSGLGPCWGRPRAWSFPNPAEPDDRSQLARSRPEVSGGAQTRLAN